MNAPMKTLTGAAVSLPEDGIDTDVIFPARFLLRMEKKGLGDCLFADRLKPDNIQDQAQEHNDAKFSLRPDNGALPKILLAGAQFGCGSSREHAVWSLVDFGIRTVIAPSFGEIFANNAARNGLAAIRMDRDKIANLAAEIGHTNFVIDLVNAQVTAPSGKTYPFKIALSDQQALINGWDEIDIIKVAHKNDIAGFEAAYGERRPWMF